MILQERKKLNCKNGAKDVKSLKYEHTPHSMRTSVKIELRKTTLVKYL